jgi:hypothetical protein
VELITRTVGEDTDCCEEAFSQIRMAKPAEEAEEELRRVVGFIHKIQIK